MNHNTKIVFISIAIYIGVNILVGVILGLTGLEISKYLSVLISLIPAVYFYNTKKKPKAKTNQSDR